MVLPAEFKKRLSAGCAGWLGRRAGGEVVLVCHRIGERRSSAAGGAEILVCHRIGEWRSTLLPSQFESARRAKARTRTLDGRQECLPHQRRPHSQPLLLLRMSPPPRKPFIRISFGDPE